MSRRALVALAFGILPLVAACAQVQPSALPSPQTTLAAPVEATASPSPLETGTPSPTPVGSPSAAATWTPVSTPAPTPSQTPSPKPSPTATAKKVTAPALTPDDPCATTVLKYKSTGACVKKAQQALKAAGYYSPTPGTTFGVSAANWTLVYQRSRGLDDNAVIGPETWHALLTNAPAIPDVIPSSCRTGGVVICASKAHHKLYWLKDGVVKKTVQVRYGGWNQDVNTKQWRLFSTVNGTYRVFRKAVNPSSENYGDGAMPYSTMFDPNMYVHYSAGFASVGYSGSSHGCVNVKSKADAKWIMDNTPIGAKVVVYEG